MVQSASDGPGTAFAEVREFGNTTFPRLFLKHVAARPQSSAMREKDLGIWQTITWGQLSDEVRALAGGLLSLGFKRGENLAIIGENRPRLYATMIAVQVLGGVPVPVYADAQASEMVYVFQNAEIRVAVVEDQEQVDKMFELREQHPLLSQVIFDDPRGLRNYNDPALMSYDKLLDAGRSYAQQHPGFFEAEVEKGSPEDVAAMFYTSGTTGNPKGVIHTHRNLISTSTEVSRADLPFEFMLNALRLSGGFALADFSERTGLPITAIAQALDEAERKGLITRDFQRVRPTERGLDFLSDLQALFLP